MASTGSIPKFMAIVPVVEGVGPFIANSEAIRRAVLDMSKDINKAMRQINKSPAATARIGEAAKQSTTRIRSLNNAINSGASSLTRWAGNLKNINNPITALGATLGSVGRSITRFSSQPE